MSFKGTYRNLYQMAWRMARPSSDVEDYGNLERAHQETRGSANSYSCMGSVRHSGCPERCFYFEECQDICYQEDFGGATVRINIDGVVVLLEEA